MPSGSHADPEYRCIVLPFQPQPGQPFDGVGLALHFLLGNVVVLHTGLQELWFGWRVKKLFTDAAHLAAYCRGAPLEIGLGQLGRQQGVRFWVYGRYRRQMCELGIHDGDRNEPEKFTPLPVSCRDHLVQFRRSFMECFDLTGNAFSAARKKAALWEEPITLPGLDAVGRALEAFYRFSAFQSGGRLQTGPFEEAVRLAPDAFMAHSLMGWAYYRRGRYPNAVGAFEHALTINPNGAGAMAGLIWCHIYMDDLEETLFWAGRKAETCSRDAALAREKALTLFQKHAGAKGRVPGT